MVFILLMAEHLYIGGYIQMSSFYPPWWNQKVTVYNKFVNPEDKSITWFRTVVKDCFWKYISVETVEGATMVNTNRTVCRIPKQNNFLPKHLWCKLEDKTHNFTIGVEDIIVMDEVDDIINEYEKDKRSSDLLKKYKDLQGAIVVEKVTINTEGGRNDEHYKVIGV